MQDEKQYEQLIMQYTQIKNGAEEISRMIDNDDIDSAITMIKSREQLFISCQNIRKYLELTPVQSNELNALLDEIRNLEIQNIQKLEHAKDDVQIELKKTQQAQKLQKAYGIENDNSGNILNIEE